MQVAMIVTCSHEPLAWIEQAIKSIVDQTHNTTPVIVCDGELGAGYEESLKARFPSCDWIRSSVPHRDAGDWGRTAGALHAAASGYDAIGLLDGDNWLDPHHVEKLLALDVDVATSARFICHEDGRVLGCDAEGDWMLHVDTSCFFFRPKAFGLLAHWSLIPRPLSPICDQLFWSYTKSLIDESRLTHAHSPAPTVYFRSRYQVHYLAAGLEPPPGSKPNIQLPSGNYRMPFPFNQEVEVP